VLELVFPVVFVALLFVDVTATFELATLPDAEFTAVFAVDEAGAVSEVVCNTETLPVIAGIDNNKAESIKVAAAVIVIFDNTDCVPRGPKAVLEILLVKSAPASLLPGCSKTVATKIKHEIKNNPYRKYAIKIFFLPYL
jgi:hypothetical protein